MLPKAAMPGYRLPRVAYGRYILSERGALVSGLLGPA